MKWFKDCKTIEELNMEYRRLAKKYHPDLVGGDLKTMQEINAEHDEAAKRLEQGRRSECQENGSQREPDWFDYEAFRRAVMAAIIFDDVTVELCGSWLWVTGNTKPHREPLKAAGYRWSSNKSAWYWHSGEYRKWSKSNWCMNDIRAKFGSKQLVAKHHESESEKIPA